MRREAIMARKPATLLDQCSDLEDQRVERTKLFPLSEIIAIALCAVIGGAESWVQVVLFGRSKIDWFRRFLVLEHGIPSHDTFARVFALLDPRQIQEGFQEWIAGLCAGVPLKQVAIDGKTLRGSGKSKGGAPHAPRPVHAWAVGQHPPLGGRARRAK